MNQELFNILWMTICTVLVIAMQGGFCCLESGLVRSKNSINVAVKSLINFCLASVIFFAFGFGVMFGDSLNGWFGGSFFFVHNYDSPWQLSFFMLQLALCCCAVAIVSGAIAERTRFYGFLLVCFILAGLIYPFVGHWIWGGLDRNEPSGWLARIGFVDIGGATVIHSTAGWVALAAAMVVGPRLGRFEKGASPFFGHNLPMAVLGITFLCFGWIGITGSAIHEFSDKIPLILANTMLSAAFGGSTALMISWIVLHRANTQVVMNGVVAGLVAVTASCHLVTPSGAIIIAVIAALVCFAASRMLVAFKIDDVVGVFPAHGCAGIWGTVAVALFADLSLLGADSRLSQLWVQLIGVAFCGFWSFGVSYSLLHLINRFHSLRVSEEDERIGLNVTEHDARTEMLDLLQNIEAHQDEEVQPVVKADVHTEAGQIAELYNRMAGIAAKDRETAQFLRTSEERIRTIIDTANDAFIGMTRDGIIQRWNTAAEKMFGWTFKEAIDTNIMQLFDCDSFENDKSIAESIIEAARQGTRIEVKAIDRKTRCFPAEISASVAVFEEEVVVNVFVQDITRRKEMYEQLSQSQKLKSIGQLAAGVAHEINTPAQFVGDNTRFLKDAFTELKELNELVEKLVSAEACEKDTAEMIKELEAVAEKIDLQFLDEEIPLAIDQTLDGVERVKTIVMAMKQFSHPAGHSREKIDLNQAIDNTLTISRNEWRSSADVIKDYESSLPGVNCYPNEVNQVILGMIVNAVHAIEDKYDRDSTDEKGSITISTRQDGDFAVLSITDSGIGIPPEHLDKVFDPFFTTKEPGRGTGQGLNIAYKIIHDKHGGSIEVNSTPGTGTTFTVRLPIACPVEVTA